ncbi:MAG: heat-inducible transcriptional repressor HrcA [Dehalococcoidales bacterium]|nr:heat-inducible transcriptional repressor HrcA [Dehalococcoidales bacterium]
MLNTRRETILKSIVRQYIAKATPVSSQSIIEDNRLGVSSATIRNEMAYLEEENYITRPHSSAGGIPLDKGYRHYVDTLEETALPMVDQRLVAHLFHQVERELEEWLNLAATLIAQLAQNIAVITPPKPPAYQFKHLELIALHHSLVLIVLVLRGARAREQLITFPEAIPQWDLATVANRLNSEYADMTSPQIAARNAQLSPAEQQITECVLKMMRAEDNQQYQDPYLDGMHFILNQPEFAQSRRLLALMELVEQRKLLQHIMPAELPFRQVRVVIGRENKAEAVQEYSVVISQYGLPHEAIGTISVVGPTRMPYERTISTVDYLSLVLSRLVAEVYGR